MEAIRNSCPIRLVPTYILPAKERRLLGKFQPDSFKTERLVCVETDGRTDVHICTYVAIARSSSDADKEYIFIYLLYSVATSLKLKVQGGIGHSC